MYQVWNENEHLPLISELKAVKSEQITIKPFEPEKDGYIFLHGLAIVKYRGRMYCTWAHNKVLENSDDEEVNFAVSDDDGRTWSPCIRGNLSPEKGVAVSHGAFLVHQDALYFFAPQFKGQLGKEMLRMNVYRLDDETERFVDLGIALDDRFWPMCEPILMENGNYLMAGIYVGDGYRSPQNAAAVAISRGDDILHWDMVKVEKAENVKVWGECTVIVRGADCKMYCREHSGKQIALYAESHDFGATWSKMDESNMPMVGSKPYAGVLSDGRRYLICSSAKDIRARNPLTIALTRPNEDLFSAIYSINTGKALSYPYAVEIDGKLYIAYSSNVEGINRNIAELLIIDIKDLPSL